MSLYWVLVNCCWWSLLFCCIVLFFKIENIYVYYFYKYVLVISRVRKCQIREDFFYLEKGGGGGKKEVIYNLCDFFLKCVCKMVNVILVYVCMLCRCVKFLFLKLFQF